MMEKLASDAREVLDWIVAEFATKYAEEKDGEKRKLIKAVLNGALCELERVVALSAISKLSVLTKKEGES